jgi:hypothetical protein
MNARLAIIRSITGPIRFSSRAGGSGSLSRSAWSRSSIS